MNTDMLTCMKMIMSKRAMNIVAYHRYAIVYNDECRDMVAYLPIN
jgi:hypothetical protein